MLARPSTNSLRQITKNVRAFSAAGRTWPNPFELPSTSKYPNHSNKVNPPAQASSSPVTNDMIPQELETNKYLPKRLVPIQLRQTGDGPEGGMEAQGTRMLIDCRSRKGPFWHLSQEAGAWCHTIYNKTYHPRAYIPKEEGGPSAEYKYLTEHVTMWNVAVERQVMVKGPDANAFVDYVVTRKCSQICPVGKCKYIILTSKEGGVLNDPILLRVEEDEWWFSIADSDMNMYLKGVNHDDKFDVQIEEIDVAPVQIQGPKAPLLMDELCGNHLSEYKYYDCRPEKVAGCDVMVTCSGFSAEKGYEIYLRDATKNAEKMWNHILEVGAKHNIKVIAPGHHRRIEGGFMSYNQDLDWEVTPYQCGLGWQVDLKRTDDFIGKKALKKIHDENLTTHKLAGLLINAHGNSRPIEWYNADFYHVFAEIEGKQQLIGYVTSAWFSPTQDCNIAMAMLPVEFTKYGTKLGVALPNRYKQNDIDPCEVVQTPFKVPENKGTGLATTGSKL